MKVFKYLDCFVIFFVSLIGVIPIIAGIAAIAAGQAVLGGIILAIGIVALLLISLISSALNSIIVGALYLYAAEGSVPQQFDDRLFRQAFQHK